MPNCPKLPVPHAKGRRPGLFAGAGVGRGLKYGFTCVCSGAAWASRTGESFPDFLAAASAGAGAAAALDRGLRTAAGAGGSFSEREAAERDRFAGGDAGRSGDAARLFDVPLTCGLGADSSAAFEAGARDVRRGGMAG